MSYDEITERALTIAVDQLERGIQQLGMEFAAEQQNRLLQYLVLLEKWNQVYNLTAIREFDRMVSGHLLDCLCVIPHLPPGSLLDVGSGAGLPGIPIAIAQPAIEVTLLDSSHKKAAFLRQVVADLAIGNASVACERVESWPAPRIFDNVISRAFADLAEFVAMTERLLAPQGLWLAMKGVYPYEEIERLPPACRVRDVIALRVPGLDAERHLVRMARA